MAETLDAIVAQKLPDAVYWFDVAGRTPKRVSLHAAPVNVAEGLRKHLFEKMPSVVMTSATLCTAKPPAERKPRLVAGRLGHGWHHQARSSVSRVSNPCRTY